MAVPSQAGRSNATSYRRSSANVNARQATVSDVQAEAEARAVYLRAKLAQLRTAYVVEKDGVLPPLAVPRPASLQIDTRRPTSSQSPAGDHLLSTSPVEQSTSNLANFHDSDSSDLSEWSRISHPLDDAISGVDDESLASFDALSLSEVDALSFSSRLARINSDAARYFDAYRDARIDALESQFARRAMSRALARREAENTTLKSILRVHTLERNLRDSETVLKSAQEVERLLDNIAAKEAELKLFSSSNQPPTAAAAPPAAPSRRDFVDDRDPHDPHRDAVKLATNVMCPTFGDQKKAIMYAHDNIEFLPPNVSMGALIALLGSGVVQEQFELVVREAEDVVYQQPYLTHSYYRKYSAASNSAFDRVPFYINKENVRAVILRPGFIEDVLARIKKGLLQAKKTPGWSRIPKDDEPKEEAKEQYVDTGKTTTESKAATEEMSATSAGTASDDKSGPIVQSDSKALPTCHSTQLEDEIAVNLSGSTEAEQAPAPSEAIVRTDTETQVGFTAVPVSASSDSTEQAKISSIPPFGMSKNQYKKQVKRLKRESRVERVVNTKTPDRQMQISSAPPEAIKEAEAAYVGMRQEASAVLQALLARHKMLAQQLRAEIKLQNDGFYRLSRAEMDVLNEYPQAIVLDGETYVASAPLPESTGTGGHPKGKGKEEPDLVTSDLDGFRREWKAELGNESDGSSDTEVALEWIDEDDEEDGEGEGDCEGEEKDVGELLASELPESDKCLAPGEKA